MIIILDMSNGQSITSSYANSSQFIYFMWTIHQCFLFLTSTSTAYDYIFLCIQKIKLTPLALATNISCNRMKWVSQVKPKYTKKSNQA